MRVLESPEKSWDFLNISKFSGKVLEFCSEENLPNFHKYPLVYFSSLKVTIVGYRFEIRCGDRTVIIFCYVLFDFF